MPGAHRGSEFQRLRLLPTGNLDRPPETRFGFRLCLGAECSVQMLGVKGLGKGPEQLLPRDEAPPLLEQVTQHRQRFGAQENQAFLSP
jgi:hypothetical protein